MELNTQFIFIEKYNKLLTPILAVLISVLFFDIFVEYAYDSSSFFFYKDVANFFVVLVAILLWHFNYIKPSRVLLVSFYSIILSVLISLPFRVYYGFPFESYFLKIEIIIMILTFAIGVLVHPVHKIITLILNLLFIIACIILTNYPIVKFLFFGLLVSGAGIAGYIVQTQFLLLNEQIVAANKLIVIQNNKLSKANVLKDELMKVFGHDLKTPFNQLVSLTDLMEDAKKNELTEIKSLIKESATEGNKLLESLLSWVKSNNDLDNHFVIVNLSESANNVIKLFQSNHQSKNIIINNKIDDEINIRTDLSIVETLFRNFISNAIKYSKNDSEITLKSNENSEFVQVSIIDQGIGMNKVTLDSIRKKEIITSTEGTNDEKGTGLGIGICYKLIEEIKGTITVKSELNYGTTIEINIPKISIQNID